MGRALTGTNVDLFCVDQLSITMTGYLRQILLKIEIFPSWFQKFQSMFASPAATECIMTKALQKPGSKNVGEYTEAQDPLQGQPPKPYHSSTDAFTGDQ